MRIQHSAKVASNKHSVMYMHTYKRHNKIFRFRCTNDTCLCPHELT